MKQTHEHSPWYAGLMQQVRRRTETLLDAYDTLPAITKAAEVERAAKALLAIARLAEFADRLMQIAEPEGGPAEAGLDTAAETPRPMNRHDAAVSKPRPRPRSRPAAARSMVRPNIIRQPA